jgi:hypothetical protein
MKKFLLSAARIATALFLAGLALGVVVALGAWGKQAYEENKARPYEIVKTWEADIPVSLGVKIEAKTKLVSDQLQVALSVNGYPAYLSDPRLAEINKNGNFTIHFVDADGFKLFSNEFKISEFTRIVGDNGENIGLQAQSNNYLDLDKYKRFSRLEVLWRLETKLTPTAAVATPSQLDHCAPNLSRTERIRRLSSYGELRETSAGSYSAGRRQLTFFYDGSLLDCR